MTTTNRNEEALGLAKQLYEDIESGVVSLNTSALRARRLALMLEDQGTAIWLAMEINGMLDPPAWLLEKKGTPEFREAVLIFAETRKGPDTSEFTSGNLARIADGKFEFSINKVWAAPLDNLEQPIANPYPEGPLGLRGVELDHHAWTSMYAVTIKSVLQRVRNRIYEYALKMYIQVGFGSVTSTIFDEYRKVVDTRLYELCPDAIEKLSAVYERLASASPEEWSQAVLSCRRLLKAFADAVYPPKDEPVKGRVVDDQNYKNRLWVFAEERIKSESNKELVQSQLSDLGSRIDKLYSYTNKGTHDSISREEVDRAVIHTYLLLGDLVRLAGI